MSFPFNDPDFKPKKISQESENHTSNVIENSRLNRRRRQKIRRLKIGLLTLVIILVVVVVSFFLLSPSKKNILSNNHKTIINQKIRLIKYVSSSSNIIFYYPSNWKVVNNHHGLIEIFSPVNKILNQFKQYVNGKIEITINQKTVVPPAFGNFSLAVLNSKLVKYTNPTSLQFKQTYLTFAQYPSTNTVGGLNAIFLTGDFGYEFKQVIPIGDMLKLSPLIFISFNQCSNKICSVFQPMTVNANFVNQNIISHQTYKIIESIEIT